MRRTRVLVQPHDDVLRDTLLVGGHPVVRGVKGVGVPHAAAAVQGPERALPALGDAADLAQRGWLPVQSCLRHQVCR